MADYKKVVAKKLKEDLQAAVPYEGHGETKALPYQGNGESKGSIKMKLKSRLYEEERMDLKMDKHEGRMDLDGQAYWSGPIVGDAVFSNCCHSSSRCGSAHYQVKQVCCNVVL